MKKPKKGKKNFFENFAANVAAATGSTPAFIIALAVVIGWALSGPFFDFSETWQLVINTGTTIITFLMVFLIQKAQNKDSLAIQLKLNELVASNELASNRLVNVEGITEDELKVIKKYYLKLSEDSQDDGSIHDSHSIDEASQNQEQKMERRLGKKKPAATANSAAKSHANAKSHPTAKPHIATKTDSTKSHSSSKPRPKKK